MCIVYNSIGCLTAIKSHLRVHNVNDFHSVGELIEFQHNYSTTRQQIVSSHSALIEQEKIVLCEEIAQLYDSITTRKREVEKQLYFELEDLERRLNSLSSNHANIFYAFIGYIKRRSIRKKIRQSNLTFRSKIDAAVSQPAYELDTKSQRYQYIVSRFDDAVRESSLSQLQVLDRNRKIIEQINTSIYGALGEQKVVKVLENLPDDYILINDFNYSFHPALYNRQENEYIKSIQADHVLICSSGIFLIETKNWSDRSLDNYSLRSPVQQIKRTNFALFKLLSGDVAGSGLNLNFHHWGRKKVPVKNLIVLTNRKPREEFQYVKILTLNELLSYVKYFKPCLLYNEVQMIADYLLRLNNQNGSVRKLSSAWENGNKTY